MSTLLWPDIHSEFIPQLSQRRLTKTYRALGTTINLTLFGTAYESQLDKAFELIQFYEDLLTVNRTNSEVMAINQAAGKHPVQVSYPTFNLIQKAWQVSCQNRGFNAAIGPLVKLWKIGFAGAKLPKKADIEAKLQLIDAQKIQINPTNLSVYLPLKGMELDLGGIAKGYIADRIQDLWRAYDLHNGIIDLGGDLLLMGSQPIHPDQLWRIGIQDPNNTRGQAIAAVKMPPCSIVTSGIYERRFEYNGHSYHHILDSLSGYPKENDLASVTVFSKYSLDGEIETTNLFFAGHPQTNWTNADLYGAVFVTKDQKIWLSGFKPSDLKILNPAFEIQTRP
ncbi:FAD:protein FMN transferase [Ligilactobacillus sp. Marseille-Q7487]|uniref:FAD:protein FMN transferase n=1 Tax=Ligilactobacillus sp. Marseille-Q7487 TaxID=3022128 RepID=UPI0024A8498D|nr:FAD:protein FMN transferase [Ligilactobacillus sp. Marseille-Q7487]